MATHSSFLARKIPRTEHGAVKSPHEKETNTPVIWPGEFHGQRSLAGYTKSMGSQRVGHDGATFTLVDLRSSLESSFKMQIAQPNSDSVGLRCVW